MNGIIFLGCSFTWGQGLYFYSDLDTIVLPKDEYIYNQKDVSHAQIKYKDKFKFARLVADRFKTFEVCRDINGGCEDHSFQFLDNLFMQNYVYEDFDYVVLQISHIFRNTFHFEHESRQYSSTIDPRHERIDINNPFYKWYDSNNITIEKWKDIFIKQQIGKIKSKIEFYESRNIKFKIISWQEDVIPYIKSDLFLNEKFVTLSYNNRKYETISLLQEEYSNMTIKYDYDFFGDNPPSDHHPSITCHKVIADSLISSLEMDEPLDAKLINNIKNII